MNFASRTVLAICLLLHFEDHYVLAGGDNAAAAAEPADYGVDVSFPIHYYLDAKKAPVGKLRYEKMMQGCYDIYSKRECDATERARLQMNRDQPPHQHNYTDIGFKKLKCPQTAWEPLLEWFERNKDNVKPENWPRGNTYVNHWDSKTSMVSLEDRQLRGGQDLKSLVWETVKPILEEWTGHQLEPTSMYGVRVYNSGAMLSTHVDRLPLVSSCIIQVAQDVDEPWPIEVYSHAGKAYNVTMQPGDMVLYESHTVMHGRPFPLVGRSYANLFVHFQPVDHSKMNLVDAEEQETARIAMNKLNKAKSSSSLLGMLIPSMRAKNVGGHEQDNHDEDHVKLHLAAIDSEELLAAALGKKDPHEALRLKVDASVADAAAEAAAKSAAEAAAKTEALKEIIAKRKLPVRAPSDSRFHRSFTPVAARDRSGPEHLHGIDETHLEQERAMMKEAANEIADAVGSKNTAMEGAIRDAASDGDFDQLKRLLDTQHIHLIHNKDENEWQLLHEAVRSGSLDTVKLLIDLGADTSEKVLSGGAAMWIAKHYLEEDHPVTKYLKEIGAPDEDVEL
mmetsp:Transcript_30411/g.67256  ORF Transcript_30411/g.67256 Transcript_30411/m.67256 type:complete len:563 (-) Transcript_30411:223-1911(-)|eukprot:CAMPEP_0173178742 /NCGR_PEP_ID=MMETSP1141-20130122/5708_1 /TAXON_ID=483371 /ORGANISM="non described non described, Strain CCMP2298" /LENGTH=562 /DNA_ID=CAMNT_0014101273 /DNA_START=92 /DNA_END=1780 /DNA_ORIENTATION=+